MNPTPPSINTFPKSMDLMQNTSSVFNNSLPTPLCESLLEMYIVPYYVNKNIHQSSTCFQKPDLFGKYHTFM